MQDHSGGFVENHLGKNGSREISSRLLSCREEIRVLMVEVLRSGQIQD